MRVLEGVVEADRRRVVARALRVPGEIALPGGREEALAHGMGEVQEKSPILPAGVEHFSVGAVVILGVAYVSLSQNPATLQPLGHLERSERFWNPRAERAVHAATQRAARLGPARAHRNDASKRVRSVRDRTGAARDIDAFDDR